MSTVIQHPEDDLTSFTKSKPNNFTEETKVFLKYKDQKNLTELLPSTVYVFNITASTTNNESRFSLLFRAPNASTGIENAENGNTQVFVNTASQITIVAPEKCTCTVYNASGQKQYEERLTSTNSMLNESFKTGVYFVEISVNNQRMIQKLIIR